MLRHLLIGTVFIGIGVACACSASAVTGGFFRDGGPKVRQERAIYNANLLAYKMRYTDGWAAGYRYAQTVKRRRPVYYYRTDRGFAIGVSLRIQQRQPHSTR